MSMWNLCIRYQLPLCQGYSRPMSTTVDTLLHLRVCNITLNFHVTLSSHIPKEIVLHRVNVQPHVGTITGVNYCY